jgi:hypothetical protein
MLVEVDAVSRKLTTLALAKVIIDGEVKAARAVLSANADYEAFWLAGSTRPGKTGEYPVCVLSVAGDRRGGAHKALTSFQQ